MSKELIIKTEQDMLLFGKRIAKLLHGGEFFALFGDLGAGKTTLVRGIASEIGIDNISSPTFNIVKRHEGRLRFDHFDCYRLADYEELLAVGFEDYLAGGSVIVMEWCENVCEALPSERLEIHIAGSGNDERCMELVPIGAKYEEMTAELFKEII